MSMVTTYIPKTLNPQRFFTKITRFPYSLKHEKQWEMWTSNVRVTKPGLLSLSTFQLFMQGTA